MNESVQPYREPESVPTGHSGTRVDPAPADRRNVSVRVRNGIGHLACAPEIAHAMLRRQQANAVVATSRPRQSSTPARFTREP